MPTSCHNAARLLVLTLALGLSILALVALACGPATPAVQDVPTPESTATATPTLTPSPINIDLGPGTSYVQPELFALLKQYADGAVQADTMMLVGVGYEEPGENAAIAMNEFITTNGGVSEGPYTWRVPVSLIPRIMRRPDVFALILEEPTVSRQAAPMTTPYQKMDENIIDVVTAYELGIPPDQAALYLLLARGDKVVIGVQTSGGPATASTRSWLQTQGVYVGDADREIRESDDEFSALVPVALLLSLSQRDGVIWLRGDSGVHVQGLPMSRAEWPQDALDLVDAMTEGHLPPGQRRPTPTPRPTLTPTLAPKSSAFGASTIDFTVREADLADEPTNTPAPELTDTPTPAPTPRLLSAATTANRKAERISSDFGTIFLRLRFQSRRLA